VINIVNTKTRASGLTDISRDKNLPTTTYSAIAGVVVLWMVICSFPNKVNSFKRDATSIEENDNDSSPQRTRVFNVLLAPLFARTELFVDDNSAISRLITAADGPIKRSDASINYPFGIILTPTVSKIYSQLHDIKVIAIAAIGAYHKTSIFDESPSLNCRRIIVELEKIDAKIEDLHEAYHKELKTVLGVSSTSVWDIFADKSVVSANNSYDRVYTHPTYRSVFETGLRIVSDQLNPKMSTGPNISSLLPMLAQPRPQEKPRLTLEKDLSRGRGHLRRK